jgi:hypothetical protein
MTRILFPIVVVVVAACGTGFQWDQASRGMAVPDWLAHLPPKTSGDESCPVVDINQLAQALSDTSLIGCELAVDDVRVERLTTDGFWVATAASSVLVVPAEGPLIRVEPGERVDLHGEVKAARSDHRSPGGASWVYAYTVRPAWVLR